MTNGLLSILLIGALFNFVSCSSEVEDKSESKNSSTFSLSKVEKVSARSVGQDKNWPELKDLNVTDLKVCLIDNVYKESLDGVTFEINTDNVKKTVVSDVKGCVTWQETIEFDYTADETFYLINGTIEGSGNFKGIQDLRVAINPWSFEVVDLEKGGSVGKLQSSKNKVYAKSLHNQIDLKEVAVEIEDIIFEPDYATILRLDVKYRPYILRRKIDGSKTEPEYLTNGQFDIDYLLIEKQNGSREKTILAEINSSEVVDQNGFIQNNLDFEVKNKVEQNSIIELAIRIKPKNIKTSLGQVFSSIILDSIGGKKVYSADKTSYSYNQIQKLSEKSRKSYIEGEHGFVIDDIDGAYLIEDGVANGSFLNTIRERKATVKLKILDSLFYKGVNSSFSVKIIDTTDKTLIAPFRKETLKEKNSGVIEHTVNFGFDDSFEFDYRKYIVRVEGLEPPFEGVVKERVVFINPRVKGDGFLIDKEDLQDGKRPTIGQENKAKIYIHSYELKKNKDQSDETKYFVNKDLDLMGERELKLVVHPKLRVLHNYSDDNSDMDLPNGQYKVKLMVMTPKNRLLQSYDEDIDLNDFYMITGAEDEVSLENGRLTANLSLPHLFVEKHFLSYMNIGVLTIEPVNPDSKILGAHHVGEVEVLRTKQEVVSLYDSSLKNANQIKVINSNREIAKIYSEHIKYLKYKLKSDDEIRDPFERYKEEVEEDYIAEDVMVINNQTYSVDVVKSEIFIADTEEKFLNQYPQLELDNSDLNDLFSHRDFSGVYGTELCKLFYDPSIETVVWYQTNGPGAMPQRIVHKGLDYSRCKNDPESHLKLTNLKFVKKILTQPGELQKHVDQPTVNAQSMNLDRNDAYFSSRGNMFSEIQGERTSKRAGFGNHTSLDYSTAILKGPMKFFTALGPDIGVSIDYYKMSQNANIESDQRRIINQNGVRFLVSKYEIGFEAEIRNCYLISPRYVKAHLPKMQVSAGDGILGVLDWFRDIDRRRVVSSNKRHIVCKEFTDEEIRFEPYFFVRMASADYDDAESMAMAKNTIGSIMRGQKAYEEFRKLDLDKDKKALYLDPEKEAKLKKLYADVEEDGLDPYNSFMIYKSNSSEVVKRFKYFMEHMNKEVKYKDRLGRGYPGLIEPEF